MDILPLGADVSSPPAQRALAAAAATTEDKEEERCAASALKSSSPLSPSLTCCSSLGSSRKQQQKRRRLDFSQVFCGGHQAELKQLLEYYEGVQRSPHPQAMAVIVESHSGMGKTVLIDRFRASILLPAQQNDDDSRRKKQPLVCRGKFEERTAASEPFSAIAEAMKELCDQIVASSSSRNSTSIGSSSGEGEDDLLLWQKRVHDGLGDEIIFLQEIFPKMERLLQNSNSANSSLLTSTTLAASAGKKSILSSSPKSFKRELKPQHSSSSCSSTLPLDFEGFGNLTEKEWRFERFRLAFRSLIRIVSTLHGAPLVLLLDDLHWADPDSVALLHTLLEDSQRHRQFMLVAATRPNMDPAAVLMQPDNSRIVNDAVRHEPLRGSTQIRLMQLRNLRPHDVTCFLLHLLERAPHSQESSEQQSPLSSLPPHERDYTEEDFRSNPDVVSLAQLIFDKTYGNSFAVLQLLRLLEQEQLVYYSPEKSQWTWDIDELMQHESTNCLGMQSHTTAAGNHVVDDHNASVVTQIVVKSLQRAPEQQRRAVVIASVFGVSHFEVTTIVHAMKFLERDCNISSSQGESETCAESRKETAGCMKFVGHGDDRNNVDMGNVYGDASSTFLDENSDDYDEDSLDPYQVNARVRIMHKVLEDAARNGFVTETEPGQYKFTHDRIREAAYSLLPPDGSHAKQLLHLRIGRQLRSWMDQFGELGTTSRTALTSSSSSVAFFTSEESLLLHATKQLNLGAKLMTDTWEKLDLAEQNFLAAELAAKKTSFSPAMEYLEQGLKHLGDAPWKEHYTLTHKLNVALARIQYSCGRFHDSVETADEILSHGKTFRDKQPVYHTKLLCLQQVHQVQAQEFVLDILDELGHKFPRRFLMLHLLYGMRKVSGLLKGMSDDDILHIPNVQPRDDEHLHDCAEFLNRLAEISFMGGDTLYFPLFAIKILELTLELGLFILSPSAFLSWGIIQGRAGKLQDAVRFGRLSLTMAQSSHGRQHFARVRLAYYGSIFFWQLPLRDGIVPVREALQQYWKFGALDYVYLDVCILNRLIFACGEPLAAIALEFEKTAEVRWFPFSLRGLIEIHGC
jgi:predicted ATPase